MNILYLCKRKTFELKLARERFHSIQALSKIANVHYSGIGWPDYDKNLTVQENINNMKHKFDICIVYKPLELKKFRDINIPKCIRYNEMYDVNWTLKEIKECGSKLVICHHLNDCEKYQKMKISNVKFVYIGHCAEKTIFKNLNLAKEYDITLLGCISSHYPLRNRFLKLLPHLKKKYKCLHHKHPGYDLQDAYTDKYLIEMAKIINKSKIILTCSSIYKYALGKYIEIPMCESSIICGDIPNKVDNYNFVVEINDKMNDNDIIEKISYYLDNESKRLDKIRQGIEFSKNYTHEHYANRFLLIIKNFL